VNSIEAGAKINGGRSERVCLAAGLWASLIEAIAKAHHWLHQLISEDIKTATEIALAKATTE
jgi:hypothetical protein